MVFYSAPVEKVKKSGGKVCNEHTPVWLLFLKTVEGGKCTCDGMYECECICLRASLKIIGVSFLGRAPGRCMSHTSHGEKPRLSNASLHIITNI